MHEDDRSEKQVVSNIGLVILFFCIIATCIENQEAWFGFQFIFFLFFLFLSESIH